MDSHTSHILHLFYIPKCLFGVRREIDPTTSHILHVSAQAKLIPKKICKCV